ncbi:MAG: hypothetical protein U1G05_02895 [Kiritimatiellia bacterium]
MKTRPFSWRRHGDPLRTGRGPGRGRADGTGARVMEHIRRPSGTAWTGLYAESETKRHPDFMWPNGVMFTALVAAARHEPETYRPVMEQFFTALDAYWDAKAKVPGYEPSPVAGGTGDKYYDDNAWMVITLLEPTN